MKKSLIAAFLFISFFSVGSRAQSSDEVKRQISRENTQQQRRAQQQRQTDEALGFGRTGREMIAVRKPDGRPYTKSELKKIKQLLEPSPEDSVKYNDFLKTSRTGIFRLFPNFDCESKNLVQVDGNCENFIPQSWSYSFRTKKHIGKDFFDIRLNGEEIFADGFLSQGIIVELGDVPLENVTLESGGIKFLSDFKPELQNAEAKKQYAQIENVVESGGYKYTKSVKAAENTTYAARFVAYRNKIRNIGRYRKNTKYDVRKYVYLDEIDKRKDLIIAFRIINKGEDGNFTILWKELGRENSPELEFKEGEMLSDLKER